MMTEQQFLQDLDRYLRPVKEEDRREIMQDYVDHFAFALAEGKTEGEVADSLGSPKQLAREILADYRIVKMETTRSMGDTFRAVWSVIGLGFLNLLLVLSPLIVLVALVFSGWVTGLSFVASPLLVLASAMFQPMFFQWADLFLSLLFCGAGIFLTVGMVHVTGGLKNLLLRYLKFNISVVKGGR